MTEQMEGRDYHPAWVDWTAAVSNGRKEKQAARPNSARVRTLKNQLAGVYGVRCYLCGSEDFTLEQLRLEHRIPLVRIGGSNAFENLGLACTECDTKKGELTEEEFRASALYRWVGPTQTTPIPITVVKMQKPIEEKLCRACGKQLPIWKFPSRGDECSRCLFDLDNRLTQKDKPKINLTVVKSKDERVHKMGMRRLSEAISAPRKDTKQSLAALAWAANKRGRAAWQSEDVFGDLVEYFRVNNIPVVKSNLRHVLAALAKAKYVDRRVDQRKHKTTFLAFYKDVDLTGIAVMMTPDNTPDLNSTPEPVAEVTAEQMSDTVEKMPKGAMPPTPSDLAVINLDKLVLMLKDWYRADPEAYIEWSSTVVSWLEQR